MQKSGIHGYGTINFEDLPSPRYKDRSREEWQHEFSSSREQLLTFLRVHEPFAVLAKTSARYMIEVRAKRSPESEAKLASLQQGEIELLQALLLSQCDSKSTCPTSPGSFVRFWPILGRHVSSFIAKLPESDTSTEIERIVSHRARVQTIHYRNLFVREDCENVLLGILQRVDRISTSELGYKLSEAFAFSISLLNTVTARLEQFYGHINTMMSTKKVDVALEQIAFFAAATPMAGALWRRCEHKFHTLDDLRFAGYQVSELANAWIYTLDRDELAKKFPPAMLQVLDQLSIRRGELAGANPEHIYMNNPIWTRPYIKLDDGNAFIPLPQMILSFPFAIIEKLIDQKTSLRKAYEDARAYFLESETARVLRKAMPHAKVYEGVEWTDPDTGIVYENDIVVIIGNFIFFFEAKSGRISDAARRGGNLSLESDFKKLFIEPAQQAARLENHVNTQGAGVSLHLKATGKPVDLGLGRPKVVHKFSICLEHFASLTSAKTYLRDLGLIGDERAWAPVLSLGELLLVDRFLDTEISFCHYLTRRATLEDLMEFEGDEQDLLAMYLTNGMWIDPEVLQGRRVLFYDSDQQVRRPQSPRTNRMEVVVHGVQLSPMWLAIVKEIYQDEVQTHPFDIINTILNQQPPILREFEKQTRRWNRGENINRNTVISRYNIGSRRYILVVHLMKEADQDSWRERSREIAYSLLEDGTTTDCAVFLRLRRSKVKTFDGVSFFRVGVPDAFHAEIGRADDVT